MLVLWRVSLPHQGRWFRSFCSTQIGCYMRYHGGLEAWFENSSCGKSWNFPGPFFATWIFLGIFHSRGISLFPKNHGSLENGGIFEMWRDYWRYTHPFFSLSWTMMMGGSVSFTVGPQIFVPMSWICLKWWCFTDCPIVNHHFFTTIWENIFVFFLISKSISSMVFVGWLPTLEVQEFYISSANG